MTKEKQSTAMQQFMESLDTEVALGFCTKKYAERLKWYIETYSIPIERKQIVDAYNQDLYGGLEGFQKFTDGSDYFTTTFKQ